MRIDFDSIANRAEMPQITLCNPNKNKLHDIDGTIYDTDIFLRFNALSEFTFTVPSKREAENGELVDVSWYDLVKCKRLIFIENIGYFSIVSVKDSSDGVVQTKDVTAYSLESELNFRKVNLISGTYKFYDLLNNENTLLGMVLNKLPSWSIGYVDVELLTKYRTFDVTEQTVYNFLMTTVEQSYECIFTFDFDQKKINAYTTTSAVVDTDITLSFDNLCKHIEVEEMSEELVTALKCTGGGDLDIYLVNPLGTDNIYNFNYFVYAEDSWMAENLKQAIIAWNTNVSTQQPIYANLVTNYRNKNIELVTFNGQLVNLNNELATLENMRKDKSDAGLPFTDVYASIVAKQVQIKAKETQITNSKANLATIYASMVSINNMLSFDNNFTLSQLTELDGFIIESSYQNDAFIQTPIMTPVEIQDMSQELYNQSQIVLGKLSQMRFTFNMESINFIYQKDFKPFTDQLRLGCMIHVELNDDTINYPVLLELHYSFDRTDIFDMTYGNRLRLDKNNYIFGELFGNSLNTANTVSSRTYTWGEFKTTYQDDVSNFLNNEFDASLKSIKSSSDEEFTLTGIGIKGRKYLPSTDNYDPHQLWINSNKLLMSDDGFRTSKLVLGLQSNGLYGLSTEVLMGDIVITSELSIINPNNSFISDELGTRLDGASFVMTTNDGKGKIILDPNTTGGIKIQSNTGSGLVDRIYLGTDGNINFTGNLSGATGTFSGLLSGGSINIGNGTFQVDALGNCITSSLTATGGSISGVNVIAGNKATGNYTELNGSGNYSVYTGTTLANSKKQIEIYRNSNGGYFNMYNNDGDTSFSLTTDTTGGYMSIRNAQGDNALSIQANGAFGDGYIIGAGASNHGAGMFVADSYNFNCSYAQGTDEYNYVSGMFIQLGKVHVFGNLTCTGTKPATVQTENYGWRELYAEESDKLYFSTKENEFTHATSDGKFQFVISLDPIFVETIEVNSVCPYKIQLTPYADARVWVKARYDKYIIVGSNVECEFSYDIRAIRKNYKEYYIEESDINERRREANVTYSKYQ